MFYEITNYNLYSEGPIKPRVGSLKRLRIGTRRATQNKEKERHKYLEVENSVLKCCALKKENKDFYKPYANKLETLD